jgi:hypothetical protein
MPNPVSKSPKSSWSFRPSSWKVKVLFRVRLDRSGVSSVLVVGVWGPDSDEVDVEGRLDDLRLRVGVVLPSSESRFTFSRASRVRFES